MTSSRSTRSATGATRTTRWTSAGRWPPRGETPPSANRICEAAKSRRAPYRVPFFIPGERRGVSPTCANARPPSHQGPEEEAGDAQVDGDSGHVHEGGNERARRHSGVTADALEDQREHRADQCPPQANAGDGRADYQGQVNDGSDGRAAVRPWRVQEQAVLGEEVGAETGDRPQGHTQGDAHGQLVPQGAEP